MAIVFINTEIIELKKSSNLPIIGSPSQALSNLHSAQLGFGCVMSRSPGIDKAFDVKSQRHCGCK
ncbi:hypothetical protein [[Limnothrix rosea] IAM M-220]|uniref:hypothetical protein n=1 Tax=[Limnothrix rosea] IAM M-220 TaxID=454133 RepID=UPI00111583F9|nr:hypothetical protein [[Limnothrix rosea] IAM M-220]